MFLAIPFRCPRVAIYVERVPLVWSEFLSVQRYSECGGRYQTLDVIVGPVRVIVSRRL